MSPSASDTEASRRPEGWGCQCCVHPRRSLLSPWLALHFLSTTFCAGVLASPSLCGWSSVCLHNRAWCTRSLFWFAQTLHEDTSPDLWGELGDPLTFVLLYFCWTKKVIWFCLCTILIHYTTFWGKHITLSLKYCSNILWTLELFVNLAQNVFCGVNLAYLIKKQKNNSLLDWTPGLRKTVWRTGHFSLCPQGRRLWDRPLGKPSFEQWDHHLRWCRFSGELRLLGWSFLDVLFGDIFAKMFFFFFHFPECCRTLEHSCCPTLGISYQGSGWVLVWTPGAHQSEVADSGVIVVFYLVNTPGNVFF